MIEINRAHRQALTNIRDWLRIEFEIPVLGQKLDGFASPDGDAFVTEVRKRRPKAAGTLGPGALAELRAGYLKQATLVQARQREGLQLERRLSDLVNEAYGLKPDEVALLWSTAPPRMPLPAPLETG